MAKKKLNPLEDPPTASSSDEEEVETLSGEEEEEVEEEISDDSSSEEEDELMSPVNIPSGKKPKPPSTAVTIAVPRRLSVTSGSESSPSKPGSKKAVALTAVKPTEKEVRGSPAVKSGKKRPDEKTSIEVSAKRAKVSEESQKNIAKDTKKPLFQRLWSEEDEISLLQGMIDFEADKGYSPYEDMDVFYELAMKSISFEASKSQFVKKIGSLKDKYMRKMKKGVESLSKGHDYECLKLAKCIWGSDGIATVKKSEKKMDSLKPYGKEVEEAESDGIALESAVKSNVKKNEKKMDSLKDVEEVESDGMTFATAPKFNETPQKGEDELNSLEANGEKVEEDREVLVNNGKEVEQDKEVLIHGRDSGSLDPRASNWFEDSFLVRSIVSLGVDEQFVKHKWSMVATETKTRMEEKWKLLQAKEMEIVLQKTDFMREVGSVIAEAS